MRHLQYKVTAVPCMQCFCLQRAFSAFKCCESFPHFSSFKVLSVKSTLITKMLYILVQSTLQWKKFRRIIFHFLLCYKIFWSLSPLITISFIKMFKITLVKLFSKRVGIFTKNEGIWVYCLCAVLSAFLSECLSFSTGL